MIQQDTVAPVDDSLTALAAGNYVTKTDAQGNYRIDGVVRLDIAGRYPFIHARADVGASFPVALAAGNLTTNLAIAPVGWIEGAAPQIPRGDALIMSVTPRSAWVHRDVSDGMFEVRDLPAGDYWVHVGSYPRKRVTITANQGVTVTFP